jgi:suppressor of G2 allele of SKP1
MFTCGESALSLSPLKGGIDPEASDYTVGKVKIEIRLVKAAEGRWGSLVKESGKEGMSISTRDVNTLVLMTRILLMTEPTLSAFPRSGEPSTQPRQRKNWESVTNDILSKEKDKTSNEDPNAGGDTALNGFFQNLYKDADEDSQRAMMKSFIESGGTTLSTNWDEVKKETVTVKPPDGSEWKKWGA